MIKKIAILIIITSIAWKYFSSSQSENKIVVPTNDYQPVIKVEKQKPAYSFKCDGRQYCSQMSSLEEARYFLANCPDTKMDGDNDGKPCERQFGF